MHTLYWHPLRQPLFILYNVFYTQTILYRRWLTIEPSMGKYNDVHKGLIEMWVRAFRDLVHCSRAPQHLSSYCGRCWTWTNHPPVFPCQVPMDCLCHHLVVLRPKWLKIQWINCDIILYWSAYSRILRCWFMLLYLADLICSVQHNVFKISHDSLQLNHTSLISLLGFF